MAANRSLNFVRPYDALAAAGLLVVLGIVLFVDKAIRPPKLLADGDLVLEEKTGPEAVVQKSLRLAVTPPQFDDMGKLLRGLGKGYSYDDLPLDKLLDPDGLKPYNVVFFTCGGVPPNWLGNRVGSSQRGGEIHEINVEVYNKLRDNLRTFVSEGGTLYASDLRYNEVAYSFPEFRSSSADLGKPQSVQAEVVMPELVRLLGSAVSLDFDKPDWCPAQFSGKDCEVLLKGRFENMQSTKCEGPLMVRFRFGKGTVIFTSFHNEKTQGEVAEKLLRFLVFTAVTAESESFVTKQSAEDGFRRSGPGALIGAPKVGQPSEHTYDCSGSPARLRFALALAGTGARLRLRIADPRGRFFEKEVKSTFLGDVRNPASGRWTYLITPLELPYENFAFTVSISEKAKE
jgi:hypothetical protein